MTSSSQTLYDKDECPFCWKVRIALAIKDISVRHITIDTDNKPAEFLALSATGKVPLLDTGSQLITESTAICAALEADCPSPALMGSTAAERAFIAELNHYSDSVIGPAIRDAIFTQRGRPKADWDAAVIEQCQQQWRECLSWLNTTYLKQGSDHHTFASQLSLAECALLPRFALASAYGLDQASEFAALHRWYQHHRRQPYFTTTAPQLVSGGQP